MFMTRSERADERLDKVKIWHEEKLKPRKALTEFNEKVFELHAIFHHSCL